MRGSRVEDSRSILGSRQGIVKLDSGTSKLKTQKFDWIHVDCVHWTALHCTALHCTQCGIKKNVILTFVRGEMFHNQAHLFIPFLPCCMEIET